MKKSKLELVDQNDKILREPTTPFPFEGRGEDARRLAEDLANKMIELGGVGLAAPQVGIPLSVFVVGDPTNKDSIMAFFNPMIVDTTIDQTYLEEGCLSFPGLYINIKRPTGIRLRFTDLYNETTTTKYSGFTARAIQHEYDHLQGVIFKDKATSYHLQKAKKEHKLLMRRK